MNILYEPFNLSYLVNRLEKIKLRKDLYGDVEGDEQESYYHFLIFSAIKSRGKNNNRLIELCERFGYELLLVLEEVDSPQVWRYKDEISWDKVSNTIPLKSKLIETFSDRLNWLDVIRYQDITYDLVYKFQDKIDFNVLLKRMDAEKTLPRNARLKLSDEEFLDIYNLALENKFRDLA